MHVDRLKLQHSVMEDFPNIIVCSCWEIIFGKNIARRMHEQKFCGLIEQPLVQLLNDNVRISPIYMMRKSFIDEKKIQYEDYSYAEDYKLWSEIAKSKGVLYMDSQPLIYSRICDMKISRKRREIQIQNISKIKKEIVFSLCYKLSEVYPMLIPLYHTNIDLLKEELISEKDFFSHWCPVKIMFVVCKSFIFSNIYSEFLVHDLNWLLLRFPSNSVRNEFRQNSFRSNYAAHSS